MAKIVRNRWNFAFLVVVVLYLIAAGMAAAALTRAHGG